MFFLCSVGEGITGEGPQCEDLAEGNDYIKSLQVKSAATKDRYFQETLDKYNYNNFKGKPSLDLGLPYECTRLPLNSKQAPDTWYLVLCVALQPLLFCLVQDAGVSILSTLRMYIPPLAYRQASYRLPHPMHQLRYRSLFGWCCTTAAISCMGQDAFLASCNVVRGGNEGLRWWYSREALAMSRIQIRISSSSSSSNSIKLSTLVYPSTAMHAIESCNAWSCL